MAIVIGLDFGNYNSYVSFIQDMKLDQGPQGRMQGKAQSLLPADVGREGIPSVFFYHHDSSKVRGSDRTPLPWVCQAAVQSRALPAKNQLRYLKREIFKPLMIDGKQVEIGGKKWLYDDAIREVVQSVLRQANRVAYMQYRETTNLVQLAYPVTYDPIKLARLIEIVESTTVLVRDEQGSEVEKKVEVRGTIKEAPAAGLDFLVKHGTLRDTVVATFDLGGGTFDAAVVSCYPGGKKRPDGSVYYYDINWQGGLPDLGGKEFTEIVAQLAKDQIRTQGLRPTAREMSKIDTEYAERTKRELSQYDTADMILKDEEDEPLYVTISRADFEKAARPLMDRMINELGKALNSNEFSPDYILLSGGASQMPMVKTALEQAFPKWKGKIDLYEPEAAISFGAARYGAFEPIRETAAGVEKHTRHIVQQRTVYDLGTCCQDSVDSRRYIYSFVSPGTPIPSTTSWVGFHTLNDDQVAVDLTIRESRNQKPDRNKPDEEYRALVEFSLPFGRKVPRGTMLQARVLIDERGELTVEAREREGSEIRKAKGKPVIQ